MAHPYACAECGAAAKVSPSGAITRMCGHDGATVIAERTADLFGEGEAEGAQSLADRARAALAKIAATLGVNR
jgi:ferredoxin